MSPLREILRTELRFLALRDAAPDLRGRGAAWLAFALLATWLAGIGRTWDAPEAELWRRAGLFSLAYAAVLAAVLWAVARPLTRGARSYRSFLVFVGMTAPPAWLYAVPVERFLEASAAISVNLAFLAVVALWRVALLVRFLRGACRLTGAETVVTGLLPLTAIVTALSIANLEHSTFAAMGGIEERTPEGAAWSVVAVLTLGSWVLLLPTGVAYLWLVGRARSARAA